MKLPTWLLATVITTATVGAGVLALTLVFYVGHLLHDGVDAPCVGLDILDDVDEPTDVHVATSDARR